MYKQVLRNDSKNIWAANGIGEEWLITVLWILWRTGFLIVLARLEEDDVRREVCRQVLSLDFQAVILL